MNGRSAIGTFLVILGILGIVYVFNSDGKSPLTGVFDFFLKEVNIEQSIDLREAQQLAIESGSVNVQVVKGEGTHAVIRLHGRTSRSLSEDKALAVKQSGDKATISVNRPSSFGIGWNSLKLTLELPASDLNALSVNVGSGNIKLEEIAADRINLKAASGNMSLDDIRSKDLTVEVSSGNIKLEEIIGTTINLEARSGNITVKEFTAETLQFHTSSGNVKLVDGSANIEGSVSSGNINIEADSLRYDTDLKTSSGNVTIDLGRAPESLAVDYRGGSGNGRIQLDGFSYDRSSDRSNVISGAFGDGRVMLKVRTGSGNFRLK